MKKIQIVLFTFSIILASLCPSLANVPYNSLPQNFGDTVVDLSMKSTDSVVTDKDHVVHFKLDTAKLFREKYKMLKLNLYRVDNTAKRHFIESEHLPLNAKKAVDYKLFKLDVGSVDKADQVYHVDLLADEKKIASYDFNLTGQDFSLKANKLGAGEIKVADCDNVAFSDCQVHFVIDRMFGPEGKVEFIPATLEAVESLYSAVSYNENKDKWQIQLPSGQKAGDLGLPGTISNSTGVKALYSTRRPLQGYNFNNSIITDSTWIGGSINADSLSVGGVDIKDLIKQEVSMASSFSTAATSTDGAADLSNYFKKPDSAIVQGSNSFAFSQESVANGNNSYAFGYRAVASSGPGSEVALGRNAEAKGGQSIALGSFSQTTGSGAVALGTNARSHGTHSIALGGIANGSSSVAIGSIAKTLGSNSVAVGWLSKTEKKARYSVAIGKEAKTDAEESFAIGVNAETQGPDSFAIGRYVRAVNPLWGSSYYTSGYDRTTYRTRGSYVIGSGYDQNNYLENRMHNSLIIGMKTKIPTIYVGPAKSTSVSGNVGIGGTTDPQAKLDVAGAVNATDFTINGQSITSLISAGGNSNSVVNAENANYAKLAFGLVQGATVGGEDLVSFIQSNSKNAFGSSYDLAIGKDAVASQYGSTALGFSAKANKQRSVAVGPALADGLRSTALGHGARALSDDSVALGIDSLAQSVHSIALGGGQSYGVASMALGSSAYATKGHSIAISVGSGEEGPGVTAGADGAIAIGNGVKGVGLNYNMMNEVPNSFAVGMNSNIPTFFVGPSPGKDRTGKVGVGTTNPQAKLDVAGAVNATDFTINGQSITSLISAGNGPVANAVHAETASSLTRGAFINGAVIFVDSNDLIVDGQDIVSFVKANTSSSGSNIVNASENDMAFPSSAEALGRSTGPAIALGYKAKAETIAGDLDLFDLRAGTTSLAIGGSAISKGISTTAIGRSAKAFGKNSVALGESAEANGNSAFAIGSLAQALSSQSFAIGGNNKALGNTSFAIGNNLEANQHHSMAIGFYSQADAPYSIAMGRGALTQEGEDSIAIGTRVRAYGEGSMALGWTQATFGGQAFKDRLINDIDHSLMIGFNTNQPTLFVGPGSGSGTQGAVGINTTSIDPNAALDVAGIVNAKGFTIDGQSITDLISSGAGSNDANEIDDRYVLAGKTEEGNSLAVGKSSKAFGKNTVAVGELSEASNRYSTTLGSESYAGDEYATALGYKSRAEVSGATALGINSKARGGGSVAIRGESLGVHSIALGVEARAEGSSSVAIGSSSSTKGRRSIAIGSSLAEYNDEDYVPGDVAPPIAIGESRATAASAIAMGASTASAYEAIALGENSYATGRSSIAIGQARADGVAAVALGGAFAGGMDSIAIGKFVRARADRSVAIGSEVDSAAEGAIVIGNTRGAYKLSNDIKESLAVGFNSDTATLFVGPSAGKGTTGKVGIGTSDPQADLDVAGSLNADIASFTSLAVTSMEASDVNINDNLSVGKQLSVAGDIDLVGNLVSTGDIVTGSITGSGLVINGTGLFTFGLDAGSVTANSFVKAARAIIPDINTVDLAVETIKSASKTESIAIVGDTNIAGNLSVAGVKSNKLETTEIILKAGKPAAGQVLTAVDSTGKAEWRDAPVASSAQNQSTNAANVISLVPQTKAPSNPQAGDFYIRKNGRDTFMCSYDGSNWSMVNYVYSRYSTYNNKCR